MSAPDWLLKTMPDYSSVAQTLQLLNGINTICTNSACPNLLECFSQKHLAFLILGNHCTRACAFCHVVSAPPAQPDDEEPGRVARTAALLGLKHVVVTSVSRDDLEDGGAGHFAKTIQALRKTVHATVEVLIPDFQGSLAALSKLVGAKPHIVAHNLETVSRLQARIRPQAGYKRSLWVLRKIKEQNGRILTKSGLMLGLGETDGEILKAMDDLRLAGCDILTLGQYRQPSPSHLPVQRFVLQEGFTALQTAAESLGFHCVLSGSYVRSSYRAGELRHMLEVYDE